MDFLKKSFTYELHALTFLMDKKADVLLKKFFNIRYSTFLLLSVICALGPNVSQVRIANMLGFTPPALTKQIPKILKNLWISTAPHPQDRRVTLISLSEKGELLVKEAQEMLDREFQKDVSSIVTSEELSLVSEVLSRIRTSFLSF